MYYNHEIFFLSYCGSLATGLLVIAEKTALYLEGGNQEFNRMKSVVKNHITLAGGTCSQLHYEALHVRIKAYLLYTARPSVYCSITSEPQCTASFSMIENSGSEWIVV